ncbi:hypothetical protein AVEN_151194-1, partial [Araneus ventricosus]
MNILFKRNLTFYQEKANNQSTRCVSVDAKQTETKTHKQPLRLPLCVGMRKIKKNKLKRTSFSRSVGSVPARAARPAAHSPSKNTLFQAEFAAFGEAVDWIIENEKKINIYTDSRSSIEALKNYRSGSEFVISIVTIKIRR